MDLLPVDYILVGITVFFAAVGLVRGVSGEFGSLCGWVAGAAAAKFGWSYFGSLITIKWALVGVTVFAALVAFGLVRVIVSKIVHKALSQPTDAILGLVLGVLKTAVIGFVLIYFEILVDSSRLLQEAELWIK